MPHERRATTRRRTRRTEPADRGATRIHFLDVGAQEYGDAVLCEFGTKRVLIDGAHPGDHVSSRDHPSIPDQLRRLLSSDIPIHVDLIVVTHAHQDHIGCLPHLVSQGIVEVAWALVADPQLGWGRTVDDDARVKADRAPIAALLAALREEPLDPEIGEDALSAFIADAATLEDRYTSMLDALADRGTNVVRYGRDSTRDLLAAFEDIGLDVIGPSEEQLLLCTDAIAARTDEAADHLNARSDAGVTDGDTSAYRRLIRGEDDDTSDAVSRPGPAINLQSIVTSFEAEGAKVLFAGDMQFADPQVGGDVLSAEVDRLWERTRERGPYSLVKLCHHGSDNGFSAAMLEDLDATAVYGICAGEDSTHHPHAAVLRLLEDAEPAVKWVRTDRNGLSTIEVTNGEPHLSIARGDLNDARPNRADQTRTEGLPMVQGRTMTATPRGEPGVGRTRSEVQPGADVEVITRIPRGIRRVVVAVDVEGDGDRDDVTTPSDTSIPLNVAGGRELPPLLFVTSAARLAENVGAQEADYVLKSLRSLRNSRVYSELPGDSPNADEAFAAVRGELAGHSSVKGVVLIGGLDVVPAERLDCLPTNLRRRIGHTDDGDDFIVWSDEAYGDPDGDQVPSLPVTRVPDARSAPFLFASLSARDRPSSPPRKGVRNVARPFAEDVFSRLPGDERLLVSQPATTDDVRLIDGDRIYLMLHGDYIDSSRFWGEGTPHDREAVNLQNVVGGRVVLTGCCWGALIAEQPAARTLPRVVPAPKPLGSSIALAFLERGATAFVGCTGSHYSPTLEPYGYFGGPLHESFWRALGRGASPAQALFEAKVEYVADFPHGQESPLYQAIEYKILRQFTCLGLGW